MLELQKNDMKKATHGLRGVNVHMHNKSHAIPFPFLPVSTGQ